MLLIGVVVVVMLLASKGGLGGLLGSQSVGGAGVQGTGAKVGQVGAGGDQAAGSIDAGGIVKAGVAVVGAGVAAYGALSGGATAAGGAGAAGASGTAIVGGTGASATGGAAGSSEATVTLASTASGGAGAGDATATAVGTMTLVELLPLLGIVLFIVVFCAGSAIISAVALANSKRKAALVRLRDLNTHALRNMYLWESAYVEMALQKEGRTYSKTSVPDERLWDYIVNKDVGSLTVETQRDVFSNVSAKPGVTQWGLTTANEWQNIQEAGRLLAFEYAYWLAEYGRKIWAKVAAKPADANATEGVAFDAIWNFPLTGGGRNRYSYEVLMAKYSVDPNFAMVLKAMKARAIITVAAAANSDGAMWPQDLYETMGLDGNSDQVVWNSWQNGPADRLGFVAPAWGDVTWWYYFEDGKIHNSNGLLLTA